MFLTHGLIPIYKCHIKVMPNVVTWDEVVMRKCHEKCIFCVKSHPRTSHAFSLGVSNGTLRICGGYEVILLCQDCPQQGGLLSSPVSFYHMLLLFYNY